MLRAYRFAKKHGLWPEAGGMADQTPWFIELFDQMDRDFHAR